MKVSTGIPRAILLAFILCSGNSCVKSKNKHTYFFTEEFKTYTLFKPNSWWVYRLDGGPVTDSIYVFDSQVGVADPNHLSYKYESYVMQSKSTYHNENIIQSGVAATPDVYNSDFQRFAYASASGADIVSYFSRQTVGYKLQLFPSHETLYKETFATGTIAGVTYNNIKVFEAVKASGTDQRLPRVIYYAPNVGIIKKELYNGQVWDLIKKQVVQ